MALGASSEVEVTVVLGRFVFVLVFSKQFDFVLLISWLISKMNQATTWNHPDHLHPHDPAYHHFLHLQLLQALLLRGHCGRQPHRDVGPRHNVHLCVWGTSQDLIHQDDWCVAGLCASDSFFWGIVFVHALVFVFVQVLLHTIIDMMRLEYDREVNHHGTIRKVSSSQIKPTSS